MKVRPLEQIVSEHRFFAGLDEVYCKLVCGCARNVRFEAGQYLFREGDPADQHPLFGNMYRPHLIARSRADCRIGSGDVDRLAA
ncbi:hypothetical protein SAMN02745126_04516 [Enhydrobacter aerosaccus]|uniref:Uncharacterized protein n=1 Tax=Enhydrobacter aerosaccus TaxID=225324 RepID=A0A1T4SAY4_9HYPH|nr:hypothetical protein SAMN02745126_04516 [Enhydrobacter aerosaccus]